MPWRLSMRAGGAGGYDQLAGAVTVHHDAFVAFEHVVFTAAAGHRGDVVQVVAGLALGMGKGEAQ